MKPNTLPDLTIPESVLESRFEDLAARVREQVQEVTKEGAAPSWESVVAPLEDIFDELHMFTVAVEHRNAVGRTDELTAIAANIAKMSADLYVEVGQNKSLFDAHVAIKEGDAFDALTVPQKKYIENFIRDAKLSGLGLPRKEQKRFKELTSRLSELGNLYQNNAVLAKDGWFKHVTDESELSGIPDTKREEAKEAARAKDLDGWVFTLDLPSYVAVMQYADDRSLREEMYTAFSTRASDQGPNAGKWDNAPIMDEMLAISHERAIILGYQNAAELSLATKDADSPEQVKAFLLELIEKTKPKAEEEYQMLQEVAKKDGVLDFRSWDTMYYLEKWKQEEYAFSDTEVQDHFPVSKVMNGMFDIVERLYGIRLVKQENVPVWHDSVEFYSVFDRSGDLIAGIYVDLYTRAGKRGGAWMNNPVIRRKTDVGMQLPVAYLECNFSKGAGGNEAYLTHYDVETLFHEFGHCLHHMLTEVDVPDVSGVNGVEWDAVELPSQFFEHWCWDKEILQQLLSEHRETGDPIPGELVDKMLAARNYDSGLTAVRQLEFALFDLLLYMEYDGGEGSYVADQLAKARSYAAVVSYPEFNRFQNAFMHIFGGGYASGYYSYKWAEVMAADAFEPFLETGLLSGVQGAKFRDEILARGGSRTAMENFIAYRGRKPEPEALLKRDGFIS